MALEQEMAEIYPPEADELAQLLPDTDCGACSFSSCSDFAGAVLDKRAEPGGCPELTKEFSDKLTAVLKLNKAPIPYNMMMEQAPCTLIEVSHPDKHSPLLITCNFKETVRIMTDILEHTQTPAFLLPVFTHGYSVDNAVHERMFKAVEIMKAIQENEAGNRVERTALIIPGLAESEKNAIKRITRWDVLVGPVSGFLAPLFILNNRDAF